MSTLEELQKLNDILYKAGLLETLCFALTDDKGHWYIEGEHVYYCWHSGSGKNNHWINPWKY